MNKDVKEKWVTALRSGKYKQGQGCLRRGDDHCCLGVLQDLYHRTTGVEDDLPWGGSANPTSSAVKWAGSQFALPPTEELARKALMKHYGQQR